MAAISRRSALVLGAGVVLGVAGCTSSNGRPEGAGSPAGAPASARAGRSAGAGTATSGSPSVRPGPSGSSTPMLHLTAPWRPSPNDIRPDVKLRAVRLVEALGTWPVGGQGVAAARKRAAAAGYDPALADQAGGLLVDAPQAAVQVLEAQYGGILSDSASVLVVCRQYTPGNDGGGTTVDVRLSAATPQWNVTALHPAVPGPPASSLSSAARAVLADVEAITLPPAAHADVLSGNVHDSALDALLTLARSHRMMLSVVRSGHPINVFGTTRPSDHPMGRAFDVWTVDGHPVVDPGTPRALVVSFMRAAAAAGSYNVGGPYLLAGGSGNQFFSDDTHHDHVHVGFNF